METGYSVLIHSWISIIATGECRCARRGCSNPHKCGGRSWIQNPKLLAGIFHRQVFRKFRVKISCTLCRDFAFLKIQAHSGKGLFACVFSQFFVLKGVVFPKIFGSWNTLHSKSTNPSRIFFLNFALIPHIPKVTISYYALTLYILVANKT